MAKITFDPTSGKYYLQTRVQDASILWVDIDENTARLVDPVTKLSVAESIERTATGLEAVSDCDEGINRIVIDATNTIIIDRSREAEVQRQAEAVALADSGSGYSPERAELAGVNGPNREQDQAPVGGRADTLADVAADDANGALGKFWDNQKMTSRTEGYQQTVGGADMAVFFMAEVPVLEDLIEGLPTEAIRKEIITIELDNVLSLQYSLIREVYPVRQMGNSNPVDYTRGPRTIAGHLAFAVFAEDVLARLRSRTLEQFEKLFESVRNVSARESLIADGQQMLSDYGVAEVTPNQKANTTNSLDAIDAATRSAAKLYRYYDAALHFDSVQLLDQMPPFHLLVIGVNEHGAMSKFILKNIHIIDENQLQGTRQPNVMNKVSFVARDIVPMHNADPSGNVAGSMSGYTEAAYSGKKTWRAKEGGYKQKDYTASAALNASIKEDLEI